MYLLLCKVQQISGSTNDPLECSEGIHYHSKIVKQTASSWKYSSLWLDHFTRRCADPGK